jgi:hypothetical protein
MSLDGKWEAGPELFEGKSDEAQCIVQVICSFLVALQ